MELNEVYAEQFIGGQPVLLGRFGPEKDYGAPEVVGYRRYTVNLASFLHSIDLDNCTMPFDRAFFAVKTLIEIVGDGEFISRRVVVVGPGDPDPGCYLRGWRATYYG
jgi:hypothetical protein